MAIRWMEDCRTPCFPVIQFPPGETVLILAGSDKSHDRSHLLHWLPDHKRSVPCTHEDCPWCPAPRRLVTYVPALQLGGNRWFQRILPVNDGMVRFLGENRASVIWDFRRGPRGNASVRWFPYATFRGQIPNFEGFDVVPSLLRMWGGMVRNEADRSGGFGMNSILTEVIYCAGQVSAALQNLQSMNGPSWKFSQLRRAEDELIRALDSLERMEKHHCQPLYDAASAASAN